MGGVPGPSLPSIGDIGSGFANSMGDLGKNLGIGSTLSGIGGGISKANPFAPLNTTAIGTPAAPPQVREAGPGPAAAQAQMTAGPQAAQLQGVGGANDFRQAQLNAINGLGTIASGHDQTAQNLVNANMAQNTAQQFAMANSARPGQGALALRNAQNNAAQNNATAAVQGAALGLNNQMAAINAQGQLAGQGYGQDISVANANAGYTQQANLAGYQGNLQTNLTNAQLAAQNQSIGAQYKQMDIAAQQANQNAALGYGNQVMSADKYNNDTSMAAQQYQRQQIGNFVNGVAGGFGGASTMFGGAANGGGAAGGLGSMLPAIAAA